MENLGSVRVTAQGGIIRNTASEFSDPQYEKIQHACHDSSDPTILIEPTDPAPLETTRLTRQRTKNFEAREVSTNGIITDPAKLANDPRSYFTWIMQCLSHAGALIGGGKWKPPVDNNVQTSWDFTQTIFPGASTSEFQSAGIVLTRGVGVTNLPADSLNSVLKTVEVQGLYGSRDPNGRCSKYALSDLVPESLIHKVVDGMHDWPLVESVTNEYAHEEGLSSRQRMDQGRRSNWISERSIDIKPVGETDDGIIAGCTTTLFEAVIDEASGLKWLSDENFMNTMDTSKAKLQSQGRDSVRYTGAACLGTVPIEQLWYPKQVNGDKKFFCLHKQLPETCVDETIPMGEVDMPNPIDDGTSPTSNTSMVIRTRTQIFAGNQPVISDIQWNADEYGRDNRSDPMPGDLFRVHGNGVKDNFNAFGESDSKSGHLMPTDFKNADRLSADQRDDGETFGASKKMFFIKIAFCAKTKGSMPNVGDSQVEYRLTDMPFNITASVVFEMPPTKCPGFIYIPMCKYQESYVTGHGIPATNMDLGPNAIAMYRVFTRNVLVGYSQVETVKTSTKLLYRIDSTNNNYAVTVTASEQTGEPPVVGRIQDLQCIIRSAIRNGHVEPTWQILTEDGHSIVNVHNYTKRINHMIGYGTDKHKLIMHAAPYAGHRITGFFGRLLSPAWRSYCNKHGISHKDKAAFETWQNTTPEGQRESARAEHGMHKALGMASNLVGRAAKRAGMPEVGETATKMFKSN